MLKQFLGRDRAEPAVVLQHLFRFAILFLPALLLGLAAMRQGGERQVTLGIGAGILFVLCAAFMGFRSGWQHPLSSSAITLYLIALAWIWMAKDLEDWYSNLTKAILLMVPLLIFGYQMLFESGAHALRRTHMLAQRLANRQDWPSELSECRNLPEVKVLRAALGFDASPALALLHHPRPEVRVAALAALEFRKDWQPGQAELVLQVTQRAEQPAVRAVGVTALGNVEDRLLIENVAQFLHDTSAEVRRAAIEALLWDTERRWGWIRFAVRRILADPLFITDGPLIPDRQMLTQEAVNDLTAWCAEKGTLALRSAMTLGAHYNRALGENPGPDLVKNLQQMLADPHTPAVLRLELGKVLQLHQELSQPVLEKLLDPANPAPLRLIAAESLLTEHAEGKTFAAAVSALRDLARLPNREIALATADVVQKRLGVDMGMALGQPLPPVHSRQAAEVARRVMQWASQAQAEDVEDSRLMSSR